MEMIAKKFTHPTVMTASNSVCIQFERLLQQHQGIIRKVAFGYARTESDRRDLMQEIALQLWSLSALLAGTSVFNLDVSDRFKRLDFFFAQEHATWLAYSRRRLAWHHRFAGMAAGNGASLVCIRRGRLDR
jgi:hypothetical protein